MSSCTEKGFTSSEDNCEIGTHIGIAIVVTFIVTAIVVGFFGIIVGLVLNSYYKKKKQETLSIPNGQWKSCDEETKSSL